MSFEQIELLQKPLALKETQCLPLTTNKFSLRWIDIRCRVKVTETCIAEVPFWQATHISVTLGMLKRHALNAFDLRVPVSNPATQAE